MVLEKIFFKVFCLIALCSILGGCMTTPPSLSNRPIKELSEIYDPRPDGKYADFSAWGATYMMHKFRLDHCGMGRRLGGEFEDAFFAIIKEMAPNKKQLSLIRDQVLRGVRNVGKHSQDMNFIDLLLEESKQTCKNPQIITSQILEKMKKYGVDWRDNYSQW